MSSVSSLPCLAVPEGCVNVEKVSDRLFDRDAAYIAQFLQGNHFSNAAGGRIITNLKPEVRDNVYCFMYPEEYAMTENDESDSSSSTSDEEASLAMMTKRNMSKETLHSTNLIKNL